MKKLLILLLPLAIACTSTKHSTTTGGATTGGAGSAAAGATVQDGNSFETAIFITEKGETAGVASEYKWIREHYPGSKSKGQALVTHNKKPYDVLTIETSDGTEKEVYFDISGFFGKL